MAPPAVVSVSESSRLAAAAPLLGLSPSPPPASPGSSRGGSFRLLQPLIPAPQKGRELSATISSTCVEQSTHTAKVQNADPTPASAVHKTKRLVYHDRLKRRI